MTGSRAFELISDKVKLLLSGRAKLDDIIDDLSDAGVDAQDVLMYLGLASISKLKVGTKDNPLLVDTIGKTPQPVFGKVSADIFHDGIESIPVSLKGNTVLVDNLVGIEAALACIRDKVTFKPERSPIFVSKEHIKERETLYEVSRGKNSFLQRLNISAISLSRSAFGQFTIASGGSFCIPFILPYAVEGCLLPSLSKTLAFADPVGVNGDVTLDVVSGSVVVSVSMQGYEE